MCKMKCMLDNWKPVCVLVVVVKTHNQITVATTCKNNWQVPIAYMVHQSFDTLGNEIYIKDSFAFCVFVSRRCCREASQPIKRKATKLPRLQRRLASAFARGLKAQGWPTKSFFAQQTDVAWAQDPCPKEDERVDLRAAVCSLWQCGFVKQQDEVWWA